MQIKKLISKILSSIEDTFQKLPYEFNIDHSENIIFYPKYSAKKWKESGAKNPNEYRALTKEACGIACLQMALGFFKKSTLPSVPFIKEALQGKILKPEVGLDLTKCPKFLKKFHIHCKVYHYLPAQKIALLLMQKKIIIASIKGKESNHLVVISGVSILKGKPRDFLIQDPAYLRKKDSLKKIPMKKWQEITNHRGISIFEPLGFKKQ